MSHAQLSNAVPAYSPQLMSPSICQLSFAHLQIAIPIQPQRSFSPNLVNLVCGVNHEELNSTRLKCTHITFTLHREPCPPLYLNNIQIPVVGIVKYLGLYVDKRLTWNPHTWLKRKQVYACYWMLIRLLEAKSHLTLSNKLKPTWTYELKLRGSTEPSNLSHIQTLISKILRKIANAPFYVYNLSLYNDLWVPFIKELAKQRYNRFHSFLKYHPNPLAHHLFTRTLPVRSNPIRRLKANGHVAYGITVKMI